MEQQDYLYLVFYKTQFIKKGGNINELLHVYVLFNSCEIGLGSAVDAAAPEISITYPEKDGIVIMNDFTMSGIASDDTGIKTILVTFISTADKKISYGPFESEVTTYYDLTLKITTNLELTYDVLKDGSSCVESNVVSITSSK